MMTTNFYETAARKAGWVLIPDNKGGRFERNASDEPECVWLCGDWKQLCEFADICNCGWQPSVCAYPYCEHGAIDAARDANQ